MTKEIIIAQNIAKCEFGFNKQQENVISSAMDEWAKIQSFPFAEYLSYHYVTVRTEEGFRHKARDEWFTTEQIWEEYNKNK